MVRSDTFVGHRLLRSQHFGEGLPPGRHDHNARPAYDGCRWASPIGWLAVGLAQGYRSLFETPVTAHNASERARAGYRLAWIVTLFAFPAILIGIAMRW